MTTDHDDLEQLVRASLSTLYPEPDGPGLVEGVRHRVRRRQRRRRIAAGATAAVALVVAAATAPLWIRTGPSTSTGSDASCAPTVKFLGGTYFGVLTKPAGGEIIVPASHRHRIGVGTIPPCNDTNHSHGHSQTMVLYAIDGFDSRALVADATGAVWQREAPNASQLTLTHQALVEGRALEAEPWIQTHTQ